MSEQNIGNTDGTDTSTETSQAQAKTYTQEEFDAHMARLRQSLTKKFEKQFSELGDIDELRQLKTEAERRKQEEQVKRGEFETILKELAQKKDAEIQRRDQIIKEYTVDVPLVNTAAQLRAVNPEQVKALLKPNVRLSESGEVEVIDRDGKVRYTDSGTPFKVEDLVKEFLDNNRHFLQPNPATTQGKSSITASREKLDIKKLDMKNAEHRKIYKEYLASQKP